MKRSTGALVLLAAGAALVLSACSSAPAPSSTGRPSANASSGVSASARGVAAACALVPDMASILGREPIAPPDGYSIGGNDRCMWVIGRDPSRFVGLTIGPSANHASTIDALGQGVSIASLGDDARWWSGTRTLSVAVGDGSFQIDLQLDAADATRATAEAIAREVVKALGAA